MVGCNQPLRQSKTVVGDSFGKWRQDGGNSTFDLVSLLVVGTTNQDEGIARLRKVTADHRGRNRCVDVLFLLVVISKLGSQRGIDRASCGVHIFDEVVAKQLLLIG